jgi:hypothetical protein
VAGKSTQGDYSREEPEAARLDRNYSELLQELRVAQTGVQVLFAFLLGIAFTQRYTSLDTYQRVFYVVTLISAACTAILLIAPAAIHRMLFREHLKDEVVELTSRLAAAGLACLAVAMLSAVLFVIDVVTTLVVAITVTGLLALLVGVVWYLLPTLQRARARER